MSRITCKTCRRVGAVVCGRAKCAFIKRPFAPGKLDSERKHKSSVSEFGLQLKAKQTLRISYGLREKQFSNYVKEAMQANETAKEKIAPELRLYKILESRLDNVVYRMGLANTRALARQMVNHGHILVNSKRVNIPSFKTKMNDVVSIRKESMMSKLFTNAEEKIMNNKSPNWLKINDKDKSATVSNLVKELEPGYDFGKVFEFYSK
jgi:small subunit ribosomal protein S4